MSSAPSSCRRVRLGTSRIHILLKGRPAMALAPKAPATTMPAGMPIVKKTRIIHNNITKFRTIEKRHFCVKLNPSATKIGDAATDAHTRKHRTSMMENAVANNETPKLLTITTPTADAGNHPQRIQVGGGFPLSLTSSK